MKFFINEKTKYNVFIVLVTLFVILKLIRNTAAGYDDDASQGGVWNLIPLTIIFYSIFFEPFIFFRKIKIPLCLKISVLYTIFAMFNSLLYLQQWNIKNFYVFFMIGCFSSVLIVFYSLSIRYLSKQEINLTLLCCILISIFTFISLFRIRTESLVLFVANIYFSMAIFPLFFYFSKNKLLNILYFLIMTISVLFAAKRTALIGFSLYVFFHFFVICFQKNNIVKFIKACLTIFVVIFIFMLLYNNISKNYDIDLLSRMGKITTDGGSGRNEIYNDVWNGYKNSYFVEKILGHGLFSIKRDFGHGHAHNDFLDILYHFGLAPCILLIIFYLSLIYEGFLMIKYKYDKANIFIGGIFISLILSLFSIYCVGLEYVLCGMTFLGIALGQWDLYKTNIKENI